MRGESALVYALRSFECFEHERDPTGAILVLFSLKLVESASKV